MTAVPEAETNTRTTWRALPPWALVPIAAFAWWVVGFLPWLLNGADGLERFGVSTLALPLFAGNLSTLVLGAGVGGLAAGFTAHLGAGNRGIRAVACAGGVAIALAITLIQSRSELNGAIDDSRLTNWLTAFVVLVTLIGFGLGLLGLTGRVGLGFSLAAVAGAAPVWLMSVLKALGMSNIDSVRNADDLTRWVGVAVLAAALIVVGLRPAVRLVAWLGIVVLAWIIAPTITAVAYAQVYLRAGMNADELWRDNLSATVDVWKQAVSWDARPLTPWLVAIAVAVAVSLWLARRPDSPPPEAEPSARP